MQRPASSLHVGFTVETVKPKRESTDWDPAALQARRWGVSGEIVERQTGHGEVFKVRHEDGSTAWYEPRELRHCENHTPEQRTKILAAMRKMAEAFYPQAAQTGCHPWIEFTGLLNEYITVCQLAHEQGIDFTQANTHTGQALPFQPYHASYLAEKLNCIYGPSLLSSKNVREAFIDKLFEGEYKLVRVTSTGKTEHAGSDY